MSVNEGGIAKEPGSSVKNKTGTWRTFKPVVTDKFTGCGVCEWYCPDNAIKVEEKDGKKKSSIDYEHCKGCLICVAECPVKAITAEREGSGGEYGQEKGSEENKSKK